MSSSPKAPQSFRDWFQNSRVVDAAGQPLVVYHGTRKNFTEFSLEKLGSTTGAAWAQLGFFFTEDPLLASAFSKGKDWPKEGKPYRAGSQVMPVYLALKNPMRVSAGQMLPLSGDEQGIRFLREEAIGKGHDGIVIEPWERSFRSQDTTGEMHVPQYVAFYPEQIRFAIGAGATPEVKLQGFHGTDNTFTGDDFLPSPRGTYGPGFYFADTEKSAADYGENVIAAELTFKRPWVVAANYDSEMAATEDFDSPSIEAILALPNGRSLLDEAKANDGFYGPDLQQLLIDLGYDSIIAAYPDGSKELVAFYQEQINLEQPKLQAVANKRPRP